MNIIELDEENKSLFNQVDNGREITMRAILKFDESGDLGYNIMQLSKSYIKSNESIDSDMDDYIHHQNKSCFVATIDGKIAGQILLHKYWE
jgi:hypothetical protein